MFLTELGVLDARLCWVLRCHIDNFKGVGLLLAGMDGVDEPCRPLAAWQATTHMKSMPVAFQWDPGGAYHASACSVTCFRLGCFPSVRSEMLQQTTRSAVCSASVDTVPSSSVRRCCLRRFDLQAQLAFMCSKGDMCDNAVQERAIHAHVLPWDPG